MGSERELTAAVNLCDERGRLNPAAIGWSRAPLHRCNLSAHWPRKKRWNYWCITSETALFSVTLSDLDYMGLAFVYYLDFATQRYTELTVMHPFGRGCNLPDTVAGDVRFADPRLHFTLSDAPGRTHLKVQSPDFGGVKLAAEFMVSRPADHETLNVVIPWSDRRFQFTSKQEALPAAGVVQLGTETALFPAGSSFACLDYGRGIWPYRGFWNWAAGSGVQNGRTVGLNLGGGWTDGSGYTENALVVDGRVTKIGEDLQFRYDPRHFMAPWSIRTQGSDRVNLQFVPFFERVARTDLIVLRSEVHQMIGRFSGTVVTEAGEPIAIRDLVGWAEEHQARW